MDTNPLLIGGLVDAIGDTLFAGLTVLFVPIAVLIGLYFVLRQLYYHNLTIHGKMRYWMETRKRAKFHKDNS